MPNQPKTRQRSFRISDEMYARIAALAEERNLTITDVVRDALEKYLDNPEWED